MQQTIEAVQSVAVMFKRFRYYAPSFEYLRFASPFWSRIPFHVDITSFHLEP